MDLRDTVTLFFRPFRPYTYHCASLARALSDHVTGSEFPTRVRLEYAAKLSSVVHSAAFARKQPLDELFVTKYMTHLDHLLHLFAVLESRIAMVLSPAATSAHALPAPFEAERQFISELCFLSFEGMTRLTRDPRSHHQCALVSTLYRWLGAACPFRSSST